MGANRLDVLAEQIADRWLTRGSLKWRRVRDAARICLREAYEAGAAEPSEIRKQAGESVAKYADALAVKYEADAFGKQQARTVPDPQLLKLKAAHWRILANTAREIANSTSGDR